MAPNRLRRLRTLGMHLLPLPQQAGPSSVEVDVGGTQKEPDNKEQENQDPLRDNLFGSPGTSADEEGSSSKPPVLPRSGPEKAAFRRYCEEGKARALALGNRGLLRFGPDGRIAQEIIDAYHTTGFYVLENLLSSEEVADLREEFEALLENAPAGSPRAKTDRHGRPVEHPGIYTFQKPLSDPMGGTPTGIHNWKEGGETKGRHQMKMRELPPPSNLAGGGQAVVQNLVHPFAVLDSALRVYGHPGILRVAEALNGPDFTPATDVLWHKPAFAGIATAWHQDPSSAWDEDWAKPGFDLDSCGFNFHASLYHCTAENGLWVLPGSQVGGRKDINALAAASGGSDQLQGAVPVICKPGDVYFHSRLVLHGAFPNDSPDPRCTVNFGFNKRKSVLGLQCAGYDVTGQALKTYDEAYILERSRMIQIAIDLRKKKYPDERSYVYQPFLGMEDQCRWSKELKQTRYGDYWNKDIVI